MAQQKGQLARPIFAKIAPHEFLVANLARDGQNNQSQQGTRPNGRATDESRDFDVHTGSLSQAHGSAAVRLGRTRVICGVRGEILPVANIPQFRPSAVTADRSADHAVEADNRRQLRDYDLLVPNLELATGSAPEFLPGGPPSVLAQVLSTRLYALLHSSGLVDAEALKIWHTPRRAADGADGDMDIDEEEPADAEGDGSPRTPEIKAYWTLYIDLLFLSFDGNPLDAAWAAIVAALRDTHLPHARWDADRDRVVCSPPSVTPAPPLTLRGLPVASTAVVCVENRKRQQRQSSEVAGAHWILHDPDRLEEGQCHETVTAVVDCSNGTGKATVVRALSKSGGVLVGPAELHMLVASAETRWTSLSKALGQGP
ncbi:exosome complex component RRP43 [Sporothrix schenckii 1099-18]|uniref:Ribosomal RNA-processing protein 43 n=2 Tax=Sporothrix schenckii TaxID=29908 RepID=U7PV82_SPOS1|nr:exosome complex component RRP43 [Sporothrix schenckii 1099-18]ERS99487.1 hypothetical protein HMPREF1624_04687 [Sporothrix schenckii ATCC 58251]KJR82781.1 exosome complex component RRP43 [Sporothrix schenckii 1099-18]